MRLLWSGRGRHYEGLELIRLSCLSGALLAAHEHDFPELFWVEEGICSHLVGGERYDLEAGTLAFVRAADRHQLRADNGGFRICNVTINPALAAALSERHAAAWRWAWPVSGPPRTVRLASHDQGLLGSWFEGLWSHTADALYCDGFLLDVLRLVVPLSGSTSTGPAWLYTALARLRDPAVFAGGVPALVSEAGVSREHLARACRRWRTRTPGQLVAEARLDHAKRLLEHSTSGIADIAAICGFGGPAQFYRLFSARYGCPPGAWRRRGRKV